MTSPYRPTSESALPSVVERADEATWLRRLVWRAFLLRAALAVTLHFAGVSSWFAPDEITYSEAGGGLVAYWRGDTAQLPPQVVTNQATAYFYLNGACLWLFDSVLPLKLLNALIGAFACRVTYLLAASLFDTTVARRAALLVAFLPSLILWSSLNIRDVWLVCLILLIAWKSRQLLVAYTHRALLTVVGGVILATSLRQYLFFVLTLPTALSFLMGRRGHYGRRFALVLLFGLAVVVLMGRGSAEDAARVMDLETLSAIRQGMTTAAGSAFGQNVDISTPSKALAYLPIGLTYFLFSPFPWQITSLLKAMSVPEVLFIYWLTPSILRGIRHTLRTRFREAVQVLMLTALLTVSYSLGSGNVGTLYRHRAQAISFYLLFAAVGLRGRVAPRPRPELPRPQFAPRARF